MDKELEIALSTGLVTKLIEEPKAFKLSKIFGLRAQTEKKHS